MLVVYFPEFRTTSRSAAIDVEMFSFVMRVALLLTDDNPATRPAPSHWLVKSQGRTTYFRPGKKPVNLPSGMTPDD